MFIDTLFIIAKKWEQPKRPSTEQLIKNVVYPYSGRLFINKKLNADACYNIDGR